MAHPLNSPKDADWYTCPSCGAEVRVGSRGCPQCTSGKKSKWEQDEYMDGVDAPDEASDFDYNDFIKREFGRGSSRLKPGGIAWKWWITAVLLLAAMIWGFIRWM